MRIFLLVCVLLGTVNGAFGKRAEELDIGQSNLYALLEMSGGFTGKILLVDLHDTVHGKVMLFNLTELVSRKSVMTYEETGFNIAAADSLEKVLKKYPIRVTHNPNGYIKQASSSKLEYEQKVQKENDVLAVYGTGNHGRSYPVTEQRWDVYQPKNPHWGDPKEGNATYEEMKAHFQGGHTIMALYALKKPATFEKFIRFVDVKGVGGRVLLKKRYQSAGEYIRHPHLIRPGSMKRYSFTILLTKDYIRKDETGFTRPSASAASAHLAAFAFYLSQLWDTTAEVVEVMQKTAIDIGKPGPDEEFGWGLVTTDHPIIWNRAIERLQQSLNFCLVDDVALEKATATANKEGFDLFHDIRSDKREIGLSYHKDKVALALTTGSAQRPFGLGSQFLQQQRNSFVQCGLRYTVIQKVSFIGIFGQSHQDSGQIRKGSIGVQYRSNLSDRGDIAFYAGYRTIRGTLGLPGYEAVNAKQVPFALHIPELRASLNWSFR